MKRQHHFIIGMGRSGTNLLLSVLNTSEKNHCVPEVPLLLHFLKEKSEQDIFYQKDINQLKKFSSIVKYQAIFKMDFESMRENLSGYKNYHSFVTAGLLSFRYDSKNPEKAENIIDKNPIYTFYLDTIHRLLPQSKFIILIRDPRGFIASSLEKPDDLNRPHPLEFHAFVWKAYARRIQSVLKKFPEQCLLVRYEDLVSDPKNQLEKIAHHLNISLTEEMQGYFNPSFTAENSAFVNENEKDYYEKKYGELKKPIHTGQTERWKKVLTTEQLQKIDFILAEEASYFDYSWKGEIVPKKFMGNRKIIYYRWLIKAYFAFAVLFYRLPISFREKIRKLV